MYRNSKLFAVHTDHLGTPRLLTDNTNAPVWQLPYSAFGNNKPTGILKATPNPRAALTNNPVLLRATAATAFNLRFPGQYADDDAGNFYNYFRSYQATQGRYTQGDPIGLGGGLNRFAYVRGNPVSKVDPTGLKATSPNMSPAPWAHQSNSELCAANDRNNAQNKCQAECQFHLDMPGRFDNFGPFRACLRSCLAKAGFAI